jgi:RHS repeat-associated protein
MILAQFKQTYGTGQSLTLVYPDDHGSSRVTVSSVGSTIQDKYSYDAWGNCTHTSGPDGSLSNFTGKFYDDTGFLYFNSRYYDPITGRFLTEDPSRQGSNWYAYCQNNPVNRVDPSGLDSEMVINSVESLLSSIGEEVVGVGQKFGAVGGLLAIGGFAMEHLYPTAIENAKTIGEMLNTVTAPIADLVTSKGRQTIDRRPAGSQAGRGSSSGGMENLPQVDPTGTPLDPTPGGGGGWVFLATMAGMWGGLVEALKPQRPPAAPVARPSPFPSSSQPAFRAAKPN